eukprot:c21558_g2_i1 orf=57-2162(+)
MPPLACLGGHEHLVYGFASDTTLPLLDEEAKGWDVFKSSALYHIDGWGAPYFFINERGNVAVRPHGKETIPNEEIDLLAVVQKVVESKGMGISLPFIIRFPDILRDRLQVLQAAFENATRVHNYQERFQGVFPVKCNQDRYVVENIVEFGRPHHFGLEAGSKPELLLAMCCLCNGNPEALLICNGYKDSEYVGLALTARQLGFNCVIVLEQEEELEIVIRMSLQLSIQPVIGVRAKLDTKHGGHFGETSGENGKFGLSSIEIVGIVQKLRRIEMLHCLQMLHFHIGSQIPSLAVLHDGVSEAAHIYCELALMGAAMKYIDIGGGLGIDYDGSNSATSDMSIGYSIEEYAERVVMAIKDACLLKNVKQPIMCSESGRALVSHHSVLVFDVLSSQQKADNKSIEVGISLEVDGLPDDLSSVYRNLECYARTGKYESSLRCAEQLKATCRDLFKQGRLSLIQLSVINAMHGVFSTLVEEKISSNNAPVRTESEHTAVYHINLSIFKSMPDSWAIDQLFPVVPLHRLQEMPTVRAILSDLTCDSDGRISKFVGTDAKGKRLHYLPVHTIEGDKQYFMGMFLGGAYQEALGGCHNLFGDPNVVHVMQCGGAKGFKIIRAIAGQTAADVLRRMQYQPHDMFKQLSCRVQKCAKEGCFVEAYETPEEVIENLAYSFNSSTYLRSSPRSFRSSLDRKSIISFPSDQVYR